MARSSGSYRRLAGTILLALLAGLSWARVAQAHALLVRSNPSANSELGTPPVTIELWFSEPLEAQFSTAYLRDAAGNEFGQGAATVDAADPKHLTLTLPMLAPNLYTVVYRTLSQADGHEWVGSFPLTVLNPDGTRPAASGNGVSGADLGAGGEVPSAFLVFSRWLGLLGAMLLWGGLLLSALVQPAPAPARPSLDANPAWRRAVRLNLWVSVGAILLGSWLQWVWQASRLDSRGTLLELILNTRSGNLLLYRQLLALVGLLVAGWAARQGGQLARLGQSLALALSLAVLATFSLGSHAAAAAGSNWAILGDLVHLVAAGAWLGGLVLLALFLWPGRTQVALLEAHFLHRVAVRFSALATLSVFVIVSSGLFTSLVHLPTVAALGQSTYGRLLLVKIGLVLLVLGLALLNHRLVRAAIANPATWGQPRYRAFLRQVGSEVLLSLGLMVVVAMLVQTPPPPPAAVASAAVAPPGEAFTTILKADDLSIHMQVTPNQVGNNSYVTHLYHDDGSPIGEVQLVRLQFVHQTAGLGQANLDLQPHGGDLFGAEGAYFNQAGPWDVTVYVRRRGLDDGLATTTVAVPEPVVVTAVAADPWQNPIAALPLDVVIGGVLIGLLIAFFLWRRTQLAVAES